MAYMVSFGSNGWRVSCNEFSFSIRPIADYFLHNAGFLRLDAGSDKPEKPTDTDCRTIHQQPGQLSFGNANEKSIRMRSLI